MEHPDIERVLFGADVIDARVGELAREIEEARRGRELQLVGVLTGAFVFLADLARRLAPPLRVGFISAASYGGGTRPGELEVRPVCDLDLRGRHVLLVEDIVDTGRSLAGIRAAIRRDEPASLSTVVLLDKPSRREVVAAVDHTGFTVPDEFLVGYGLDFAERHRNLPYIGILRRSVCEGVD